MKTSKDKIIKAAEKLFHRRGFQSTSIDNILDNTGVTKSNLYYHFKSKEQLGLLILDQQIATYEEKYFDMLRDKSTSPRKRLQTFYNLNISYHKSLNGRYGSFVGNLALEMSDKNEKFRTRISLFFNNLQKSIEECIKDGIKKEEFRGDISPKAISQLILSHIEGAILVSKAHRSISILSSGSKNIIKLITP